MRVVMTYPYSLGTPGGGTHGCVSIASSMAAAGGEVVLVPVARGAPAPAPPGVEVREAPASRAHRLADAVHVAAVVDDVLGEAAADAVIGWGAESALLPARVRRRGAAFCMIAAKPSYTAWLARPTTLRALKRVADRRFGIRPFREADAVFSLSDHTRAELIALFDLDPARVITTHWGVAPEFLALPRCPSPEPRVLFYGSFDPSKGVHDAVRAFAGLPATNASLRVAGWGDEAAVRRTLRSAGVESRTTLLGRLDHRALTDELAQAHVALLPSQVESFGLAIAEAQAAALPVVAYRAGSVPEVVADKETGLLVPAGDVRALTRAMVTILASPAAGERMGAAGRRRVAERFAWDRTAAQMLATIANLRAVQGVVS